MSTKRIKIFEELQVMAEQGTYDSPFSVEDTASILDQHQNGKWEDGVNADTLMAEEEHEYQEWLKQQSTK
jgi:hypothetical protein